MSEQNLGDLNVKVSRWLTGGLAVAVVLMPALLLWKGSQPRGKEPVPPPRPKAAATRPAPDLGFNKISPDEQVIFPGRRAAAGARSRRGNWQIR